MKNYKNLDDILKNWGNSKARLPANNDALKSEVLSKSPILQFSKNTIVKRKSFMPWLSLGFATLSILVFISGSVNSRVQFSTGGGVVGIVGSMPEVAKDTSITNQMYPMPGYGYGASISDNREFLKTYYNANLRTRHVTETGAKVEIIVRGSAGRVDSISLGEENGYMSFAIPSDKFSFFRDQIKSLVGAKLFTENISSENLLPQKQSIEERQKIAQATLANLKRERSLLIQDHLEAQKNLPENEKQAENISYQNNFAQLEKRIQQAQNQLNALQKEDKNFVENIYTVNGTISLQKINIWQIADLYTQGPLLAWIFATAAALIYWRYRVFSRIYIGY